MIDEEVRAIQSGVLQVNGFYQKMELARGGYVTNRAPLTSFILITFGLHYRVWPAT